MARLVSAIPVITEQTGRAVVLVGGLAVMCRLSIPYRVTTDLDMVNRRRTTEVPSSSCWYRPVLCRAAHPESS